MTQIVIVDKTGTLKSLTVKDLVKEDLYKKCGFIVEFTRVNKINPQLSKTFFVKFFEEEKQTQGLLLNK